MPHAVPQECARRASRPEPGGPCGIRGPHVRGVSQLTRTEALSGHNLRAYATASCVAEYCCTSALVRYLQSPVI
jgi:hypothetical protein